MNKNTGASPHKNTYQIIARSANGVELKTAYIEESSVAYAIHMFFRFFSLSECQKLEVSLTSTNK